MLLFACDMLRHSHAILHFQELDVSHKELEETGVRAEKVLRGETKQADEISETDLMRTWFSLLSEKNRLVRREQELLVQAKQLELEDAGCRLEAELREYIALDSRDAIQQQAKKKISLAAHKLCYEADYKSIHSTVIVRTGIG